MPSSRASPSKDKQSFCCDTARRACSNGGATANTSSKGSVVCSPADSAVCQDVVDVPMLEVWESFIIRPLWKDDDDDSLMGLHSEPRVVCRNHSTNRNDDGLSVVANSVGGDSQNRQ